MPSRMLASKLPLLISEEVRNALANNLPIVALESTIFTSGMPRPANTQTALNVEKVVRSAGAVPATVGVVRGNLVVGLSSLQIEELGNDNAAGKCSIRDLPLVMARRHNAGTTVSATLLAARIAGVSLFVTGGIGGVHREGQDSFDISADIVELGRSPVMTVCAGVKSFLDIGRTLEALETQGVGVCTFAEGAQDEGRGVNFPAFYSADSGVRSPAVAGSISDCASILHKTVQLNSSGYLLAVPIPQRHQAVGERINDAITSALKAAKVRGVTGKAVTPFLLQRVNELTGGDSLLANVGLIENNAEVGARIAVEFARMQQQQQQQHIGVSEEQHQQHQLNSSCKPTAIVIGGSNIDLTARLNEQCDQLPAQRSHSGQLIVGCGGVARNVADALGRLLASRPTLLTALGSDAGGQLHRLLCPHVDWSRALLSAEVASAAYTALIGCDGDLLIGVADMRQHNSISVSYLNEQEAVGTFKEAGIVCCDANCSQEAVAAARSIAQRSSAEFWFEPTDVAKATKVLQLVPACDWATPNWPELLAIYADWLRLRGEGGEEEEEGRGKDTVLSALSMCRRMQPEVSKNFAVKLGSAGLLLVPAEGRALHATAPQCQLIASVSGAGDSLVAGLISARIKGLSLEAGAVRAVLCAASSLGANVAISERIKEFADEPGGLADEIVVTYLE